MTKLRLCLLFLVWGMVYANPAVPDAKPRVHLVFAEEILNFELSRGEWKVSGLYTFVNETNTDTSGIIRYPVADFLWTGMFPAQGRLKESEVLLQIRQIEPRDSVYSNKTISSRQPISISIEKWGRAVIEISYSMPIPSQPDSLTLEYIKKGRDQYIRDIPLACYYVTTAQSWNRTLDKAKFILKVDDDIKIKQLSFPDPEVHQEAGKTIYSWEYYDFTPGRDFIVDFGF
ncbi:MAG: hypothetical protein PHI68_03565 [Candidatus Cloacimonetes bacterium]|nr:hypothetical protein [Candidatus Cloacimonadota bacterium]